MKIFLKLLKMDLKNWIENSKKSIKELIKYKFLNQIQILIKYFLFLLANQRNLKRNLIVIKRIR